MSDGHFNRAFLPHTDFQSGVRAGRAAALHQAQEAFAKAIEAAFPTAAEDEKAQALKAFRAELFKNG
jgi:hypothetical protein